MKLIAHASTVSRCLSIVTIAGATPACSTFRVSDAYVSAEDGKNYLVFESKPNVASLEFIPDDRLTSIGLLGVPAVPVYASGSASKVIALQAQLTLWDSRRFSFSVPCLETPSGQICPHVVHVAVRMQYPDWNSSMEGGYSARWLPNFSRGPIDIPLPLPGSLTRIEDQMIYKRFDYSDIPRWSFAHIQLTYEFVCEPECPSSFSLNTEGVVLTDGSVNSSGVFSFDKKRINDYDGLVPAQDAGEI